MGNPFSLMHLHDKILRMNHAPNAYLNDFEDDIYVFKFLKWKLDNILEKISA